MLFFGVVIFLYLMLTLEHKQFDMWTSALVTLLTTIGFPSTFRPKTTVLRIIHHMYMFVTLWDVTIILAFLTSILSTSIYTQQISSIQQLIDKKFRLAGDSNILDHLAFQNLVRDEDNLKEFP